MAYLKNKALFFLMTFDVRADFQISRRNISSAHTYILFELSEC